jgi:hypothetical protein
MNWVVSSIKWLFRTVLGVSLTDCSSENASISEIVMYCRSINHEYFPFYEHICIVATFFTRLANVFLTIHFFSLPLFYPTYLFLPLSIHLSCSLHVYVLFLFVSLLIFCILPHLHLSPFPKHCNA